MSAGKRLTAQEIEELAVQISHADCSAARLEELMGHLDDADSEAVLFRVEAFARGEGDYGVAMADAIESLLRLAHAAGCPEGEPPLPWLEARGLAFKSEEGGWTFKTPKAALRQE